MFPKICKMPSHLIKILAIIVLILAIVAIGVWLSQNAKVNFSALTFNKENCLKEIVLGLLNDIDPNTKLFVSYYCIIGFNF